MTKEERFWDKVDKRDQNECWEWKGYKDKRGYGQFYIGKDSNGKHITALAHRASYELLRETILNNMTIDHICRNKSCVNPNHLEIVSLRENILRGIGLAAQNYRKTHCIHGHLFDANFAKKNRKWRQCRECQRITHRKWLERQNHNQVRDEV